MLGARARIKNSDENTDPKDNGFKTSTHSASTPRAPATEERPYGFNESNIKRRRHSPGLIDLTAATSPQTNDSYYEYSSAEEKTVTPFETTFRALMPHIPTQGKMHEKTPEKGSKKEERRAFSAAKLFPNSADPRELSRSEPDERPLSTELSLYTQESRPSTAEGLCLSPRG